MSFQWLPSLGVIHEYYGWTKVRINVTNFSDPHEWVSSRLGVEGKESGWDFYFDVFPEEKSFGDLCFFFRDPQFAILFKLTWA